MGFPVSQSLGVAGGRISEGFVQLCLASAPDHGLGRT